MKSLKVNPEPKTSNSKPHALSHSIFKLIFKQFLLCKISESKLSLSLEILFCNVQADEKSIWTNDKA